MILYVDVCMKSTWLICIVRVHVIEDKNRQWPSVHFGFILVSTFGIKKRSWVVNWGDRNGTRNNSDGGSWKLMGRAVGCLF